MLTRLLQNLMAPAPEPMTEEDARLALAALLVRVARSDGDYAAAEIERIDAALAARYALGPAAVKQLRAEAEAVEAEAPDTVRFTRVIKETVPYDDRLGVIEALWQVVLADGERAREEDALMRMVASFLGIEDRDSNNARRRIERAG